MPAPELREARREDRERIAELLSDGGMSPVTEETWQRLYRDNPARDDGFSPSPGWVLERGDDIGGYIGNFAQRYRFGDRDLNAVSATSFIVRPSWRGESMKLVVAFARQPDVDLLVNTTASPEASRVFAFLKLKRLPQPGYDNTPFWVGRTAGFLKAALRKKGVPAALAACAGPLLAPVAAACLALSGRRPGAGGRGLRTDILAPDGIGGEFDGLWERKLAEGTRLWSYRTARTLRWHFDAPGKRFPAFLATAHEDGRLAGYLAVVRADNPDLGLARARIADIFVERNRPDVIRSLLAAAFAEAKRRGAHLLEVHGFPTDIRAVLAESRPHDLVGPAWPFYYSARGRELAEALSEEAPWHGCLYDGDGSL